MVKEKSKKISNSQEDWKKAITTNDPTTDSLDLEKLAKEAMKKFKSL